MITKPSPFVSIIQNIWNQVSLLSHEDIRDMLIRYCLGSSWPTTSRVHKERGFVILPGTVPIGVVVTEDNNMSSIFDGLPVWEFNEIRGWNARNSNSGMHIQKRATTAAMLLLYTQGYKPWVIITKDALVQPERVAEVAEHLENNNPNLKLLVELGQSGTNRTSVYQHHDSLPSLAITAVNELNLDVSTDKDCGVASRLIAEVLNTALISLPNGGQKVGHRDEILWLETWLCSYQLISNLVCEHESVLHYPYRNQNSSAMGRVCFSCSVILGPDDDYRYLHVCEQQSMVDPCHGLSIGTPCAVMHDKCYIDFVRSGHLTKPSSV